jgi:hypothetical protein
MFATNAPLTCLGFLVRLTFIRNEKKNLYQVVTFCITVGCFLGKFLYKVYTKI